MGGFAYLVYFPPEKSLTACVFKKGKRLRNVILPMKMTGRPQPYRVTSEAQGLGFGPEGWS